MFEWFALKSVPGVGCHLFKRLVDALASPEEVLKASKDRLMEVHGISSRLADNILRHRVSDAVKRDFELVRKSGFRIVKLTDPEYPALLLQIHDPPPFLYVAGTLEVISNPLAVVGSRNPTAYGARTARDFAGKIAGSNITVVSGMAKGIDTKAHEGAMDGGGTTVAVLGSGLLRPYPDENRELFQKIAENGAVVSEFHMEAPPDAHNFPRRNRIISGISLGTLVVEAGLKSGALITGRIAAEQNREVFAIPGSIYSFKSAGTHRLIRDGAKLVEKVADILEEFPLNFGDSSMSPAISREDYENALRELADEEKTVFEALTCYPSHIDDLTRILPAINPGVLLSALLNLELKGLITKTSGNHFSKNAG